MNFQHHFHLVVPFRETPGDLMRTVVVPALRKEFGSDVLERAHEGTAGHPLTHEAGAVRVTVLHQCLVGAVQRHVPAGAATGIRHFMTPPDRPVDRNTAKKGSK
jgi:ribulose 1,5-bisphosphate carboxylase large subunit-like protein